MQDHLEIEVEQIINLYEKWTKLNNKKEFNNNSFNLESDRRKTFEKSNKLNFKLFNNSIRKTMHKNIIYKNTKNNTLKYKTYFQKFSKFIFKIILKTTDIFLFKNMIEMSQYIFERNMLIIGNKININMKKYITGNYDNLINEIKIIKKKYDIYINGKNSYKDIYKLTDNRIKAFKEYLNKNNHTEDITIIKIKQILNINFENFSNNEFNKTEGFYNIRIYDWICLIYKLIISNFNFIMMIYIIYYIIENGGLINILLTVYFFAILIIDINNYYTWGFLYIYMSIIIIIKKIFLLCEKYNRDIEFIFGKKQEIDDYILITLILFSAILIDMNGLKDTEEFENINETFFRVKLNNLLDPLLNYKIVELYQRIFNYFFKLGKNKMQKEVKSLWEIEKDELAEKVKITFKKMDNYYELNLNSKKYVNTFYQKLFSPFNPKKGKDYTIGLYIIYFIILLYCFIYGHKIVNSELNFYQQINQSIIILNQILLICYYLLWMIVDFYLIKLNNKGFKYYSTRKPNKYLYPENDEMYKKILKKIIKYKNPCDINFEDLKINQEYRHLEKNDIKKNKIYLKNPLFYRYIFHICNLIFILVMIIIFFPFLINNFTFNDNFEHFHKNIYLKIFLLLNFFYLFIIFIQVKYGNKIKEVNKEEKMNDIYSINGKIKAYSLIFIKLLPLFDLFNIVFSFLFTKTSLNWKNWMLIDTIEDNLFKTTLIQLGGEEKILMGFKYASYKKFFIGIAYILIFCLVTIGPFFAFISSFSKVNSVNQACFTANLRCNYNTLLLYDNQCKISSKKISNDKYEKFSLINSIKGINQKYIYLNEFTKYSNRNFDINIEIINILNKSNESINSNNNEYNEQICNLKMNFEFKLLDNKVKKNFTSIKFTNEQYKSFINIINVLKIYNEAISDESSNKTEALKNLKIGLNDKKINWENKLSFVFLLKNSETDINNIHHFNKTYYLKLNFYQDIFNNKKLFWSIIDSNDDNYSFYTISEILIQIFNFFKGLTIITIYSSTILLFIDYLTKFLREEPEKIWMKWTPFSDKILKFTHAIKNAQSNMDLYEEKRIYFSLIDIIRSPGFVSFITNEVKKYVQYLNKNKLEIDAFKLKNQQQKEDLLRKQSNQNQ